MNKKLIKGFLWTLYLGIMLACILWGYWYAKIIISDGRIDNLLALIFGSALFVFLLLLLTFNIKSIIKSITDEIFN